MYHFHLYPSRSMCSGLSLSRLKSELMDYFEGRIFKDYTAYIKNDTLRIKIENYHFYLQFDRSPTMVEELRYYFNYGPYHNVPEPYIDEDWLKREGMRIELLGDNDSLMEYVGECLVIVEYFAKTRAYVLVPATSTNY